MPTSDRLRTAIEACKSVLYTPKGPVEFLSPAVAELDAAWREQADALAAALRKASEWLPDGPWRNSGIQQAYIDAQATLAAYDAAVAKGGTDGK